MTRWNRSIHLALLVIGSLATSAVAQPAAPTRQPTPQQLAAARAHFKDAEAAKAGGDYKTAATEYLAAHELFPDPEFFFDVGEVYRLAGDEPDALTYYQKYLDLEPSGRGAAAARTAVDELRRSIAARQSATKRAAEDEARRKADEDAARRKADEDARRKADPDAARRAGEDEARTPQPAPSPEAFPAAPAVATRAWYRDPIALGLLGTGVAAIGVGTGFLLSAQSADHDAKTARTYQGVQEAGDRASRRASVGSITTGAGIALVGGGVVWILLHRPGEQRTVTGWIAPGSGGLVITGPF